jgi:biopolymer transport protein TolR
MARKKRTLHSHDTARPTHANAMSEINITPMIDVLLVLLIIFMVVTPVAQRGLDIALPLPPPPNQPRTVDQSTVLTVEKVGFNVNKMPVATVEELESKLRDYFQARTDKTIFVRAVGEVPYGRVVEAMDAARGAGVERIGIISDKLIEESGGVVEQEG